MTKEWIIFITIMILIFAFLIHMIYLEFTKENHYHVDKMSITEKWWRSYHPTHKEETTIYYDEEGNIIKKETTSTPVYKEWQNRK